MASWTETGKVEEILYEIKQFEWKISDIFFDSISGSFLVSPSFFVLDNIACDLRLCTSKMIDKVHIHLSNKSGLTLNSEYYLGVKNCNGRVEKLISVIPKEEEYSNKRLSIEKSELFKRKSELMPSNVLTVICSLKLITKPNNSIQQIALDETKELKLIKLDKLSENFKDLFGDKESCDVTLKVKDKEYKAHRSILIARSSVFASTFKYDTPEKQTGLITISDCDPDSFQDFLMYLYCGKLEALSSCSAMNLYYTSDKYNVQDLKAFCIEYLMKCLTIKNVCEVISFADKYDEMQLISTAQNFFNKNVSNILETSEWEDLMQKNFRLANKFLKEMSKVKNL